MDGVLNVAKPGGWTSHDVVARLRRITGQRQIGHAGTLDPAATGVLVVCLGHATRFIEYLAGHDKWYLADVVLGVTTDTEDADGAILAQRPVDVTPEQVVAALGAFRGEIAQRPPMYSAIKVNGRALHHLARAGETIDVPPRPVTIHGLWLTWHDLPRFELLVHCGKGTYIRSLARDLGERLGTGAHLHDLIRLKSGPFGLDEAATLEEIAWAAEDGWLDGLLLRPDETMRDRPAALLNQDSARRLAQGMRVGLPAERGARAPGEICRLFDLDTGFLGAGRLDNGWVAPAKIVAAARAAAGG